MIAVELAFASDPAQREARIAARPEHRRRLVDLRERGLLVMAGPFVDDTGALLVFAAARSEVDRLVAADPYYTTEGVRVASIREWTPVVP